MLEPLPWAEIQMYFEALAKTLLTRVAPEE
jgi:hypothetical protein